MIDARKASRYFMYVVEVQPYWRHCFVMLSIVGYLGHAGTGSMPTGGVPCDLILRLQWQCLLGHVARLSPSGMQRWHVAFQHAGGLTPNMRRGRPMPCRRSAAAPFYIFEQVRSSDLYSSSAIIAVLDIAVSQLQLPSIMEKGKDLPGDGYVLNRGFAASARYDFSHCISLGSIV